MKKLHFVFVLMMTCFNLFAQELSYYLPNDVTYNASIPTPEQVIGHHVGEWHITHDRLVNYMKAIAAACPERVKLEVIGTTYETRPQLLLIFSAKTEVRERITSFVTNKLSSLSKEIRCVLFPPGAAHKSSTRQFFLSNSSCKIICSKNIELASCT